MSFFEPIAVLFALVPDEQGNTEHTEYTESKTTEKLGDSPRVFFKKEKAYLF
jgi:hypothetical protein